MPKVFDLYLRVLRGGFLFLLLILNLTDDSALQFNRLFEFDLSSYFTKLKTACVLLRYVVAIGVLLNI